MMASATPSSSRIIRALLLSEALLNLVLALPLIFRPATGLTQFFISDSTPVSPELGSLGQWIGVFVLGFTTIMLLAVPNRPGAVELRKAVYTMIAAVEVIWFATLVWQIYGGGRGGGLDRGKTERNAIWPMVGAWMVRVYVLVFKEHWFGSYEGKSGRRA